MFLCILGAYLLTNFHDATIRLGDTLVLICALFWSLHIIFIGILVEEFDAPILVGLIQTFIVSICSLVPALMFEEFILANILDQKIQRYYMQEFYQVASHLFYKFMHNKIFHQRHQL